MGVRVSPCITHSAMPLGCEAFCGLLEGLREASLLGRLCSKCLFDMENFPV